MHHTTLTDPTSVRIGILTAAAAVSIFAIGFASVPQVFFWLGATMLASLLTVVTGPKGSKSVLSRPIAGLLLLPALCTVLVRETSLMWAVVPVLAMVFAAMTWMLATNRYATPDSAHTSERLASSTELATKRDEKAAAANDETSATAA